MRMAEWWTNEKGSDQRLSDQVVRKLGLTWRMRWRLFWRPLARRLIRRPL